MKKFYIIILTCLFTKLSVAQDVLDTLNLGKNMSFIEAVDTIFKNFEQEGVELLLERSLPTLKMDNYNGLVKNHPINKDSILELYSILHLAHFDHTKWNNVFTIDSLANAKSTVHNAVPLMIINKRYHEIKPSALANGWVGTDALPFTDLSPSNTTLLEEKLAFAAAPLNKHLDAVPYIITDDFLFTDGDYNTFLINDGTGYTQIFKGQLFYLSSSTQKIDIALTNGSDTLFSSFTLQLKSAAASAAEEPAEICSFNVNGKTQEYAVWPGCETNYSNCSDCLNKVAIIVEGFDPTNARYFNSDEEENNLYFIANQQGMADKMRNAGYDVVILNFTEGLDPLEEQADVLIELITILKQKLADCNSDHEFVIIGPSSGGVISRYALAKMEENGADHNTRLYVSFDVPHQGANLPLSLQHFIKFTKNTLPLNFFYSYSKLNALKQMWLATPTKQLLKYHATETSNGIPNPAPEHIDFYNNLSNLNGNGWPNNCRKVAIANGSGSGTDFGFNPADKLFDINFLFGLINIHTEGWAINDHSSDKKKLFKGYAYVGIMFWIPLNAAIVKSYQADPIDNAPGGQGDFIKMVEDLANSSSWLCNSCQFFSPTGHEDFIPVKSAFDANVSYFHDYNMDVNNEAIYPYSNGLITPFDAIYASDQNEVHVTDEVTTQIADFIEKEIMSHDFYLQNKTLTSSKDFAGKELIVSGANVTNRIPYGNFNVQNNTGTTDIRSGVEISLKEGTLLSPSNSGEIRVYIDPYIDCYSSCRHAAEDENETQFDNNENTSFDLGDRGSFIVYPNPSQDHVHISINSNNNENINLDVYDIGGRLVMHETKSINKGETTFGLSIRELNLGTYFVKIYSNEFDFGTSKIVVY